MPVERPRECGAIVRRLEDVSDARLVRPTVRPTALLWIARERRRRAKEDAVKGLMAAPHRLTSNLAVKVSFGPAANGQRRARMSGRMPGVFWRSSSKQVKNKKYTRVCIPTTPPTPPSH